MKKIVTFTSMIVTFMAMEMIGERPPKSDFYLPIINTPQRPFLKWLCDGTKTAEGRVFRSTCKKMRKGDTIVLEDKRRGEWIFGRIKFLHHYGSFKRMLETEGVENMLPFIRPGNIEEGVRIYESFPGGRGVLREGCVAIGIDVRENNFGEIIKKKPAHQENEMMKITTKRSSSERDELSTLKRKRDDVDEEYTSKKIKHLEDSPTKDSFKEKVDAFSPKDSFAEANK